MPLDPTFKRPAPRDGPLHPRARLLVAVMLFATAPVSSPDAVDPEPTDPAFRPSPFATASERSSRSFLE
ncbi:MAG: hypothetical protein U1F52_11365 [Burkholderiales bacterium]